MLMLDDLHNLLAAPLQRQRELLNLLRYLGNELRIPLACLGTREAYLAIRTDDQLENRFEPFLLPLWEDSLEFGRLLASFEAVLPLREPSGLGLPAMCAMILRRSEGTIGEVAALLAAAAEAALLGGQERIDEAAVERAEYQPPTVHRRTFERELRVNGILVGPVPDRRWPLHPQPTDWEDLETWVRRIAEMYGVSYDAFLFNALGHTGRGARDLDQASAGVFAKLLAGTGIPIERLLAMTSPRVMARMFQRTQELRERPEGQAVLEGLDAMASRQRRRRLAANGF